MTRRNVTVTSAHLSTALSHAVIVPQDPLASTLLGDGDSANRWGKVGPRTHSIPDLVKISLPVCLELFEGLTIHSRRALIGFDRLIRLVLQPRSQGITRVCSICTGVINIVKNHLTAFNSQPRLSSRGFVGPNLLEGQVP